jgi:hypothetical protein
LKRSALVGPVLGSIVYFAVTCHQAATRPLWTDELLTYYLARLPSWADLWAALADGPDASPPLYHVAVRLTYRVLGESELATRLPSILGVWLMATCIFAIVARRCGAALAWAAALLPLTTVAYTYAAEGRPYGLWMGLSALSFLCWQRAAEGGARFPVLIALAATQAAAVACHYYAVLVLLALGLGEVARSWGRRKLDPLRGLALTAGLLPLAFLRPLMSNAKALSRNFWSPPTPDLLILFFPWLLERLVPGLVAAAVLYVLWSEVLLSRPGYRPEPPRAAFHTDELVAAVGFVALPGFALVLALTVTHAFVNRYSLPAIIGVSVLLAALTSRLEQRTLMARVLALTLGLWATAEACALSVRASGQRAVLQSDVVTLQQRRATEDLVVASHDLHSYLEAHRYGPAGLRSHLVYLVDLADTTDELMARKLQPWVAPAQSLRLEAADEFLDRHDHFLLLSSSTAGIDPSLRERLRARGARIEPTEARNRLAVYSVHLPPAPVGPRSSPKSH